MQKPQGGFFDIYDMDNLIYISDYSFLQKEIIYDDKTHKVELGGEKRKVKVEKISDLKEILKNFISIAQYFYREVSIETGNLDKDLLSNQLVFDILFDKYCKESQRMTRYNYSCYMSKFLYGDNFGDKAIDRNMKDALEEEYNIIKYSGLQDQILEFGVDLDKYAQFYTPKMNKNIQKKKKGCLGSLIL